jgi:hypothetical protein
LCAYLQYRTEVNVSERILEPSLLLSARCSLLVHLQQIIHHGKRIEQLLAIFVLSVRTKFDNCALNGFSGVLDAPRDFCNIKLKDGIFIQFAPMWKWPPDGPRSAHGGPTLSLSSLHQPLHSWFTFSAKSRVIIHPSMGIHVGIRCSRCARIHFLSALKRIGMSDSKGVYQIACSSPCGATTYFRIEDTRAFAVSDEIYRRGYAEPGEYEASRIA